MKLDTAFLRSKVARRIFMLFILCALLPIAALAIISFGTVTKQLNAQSQRRLHQASKAVALSIYDRLLFLEAEMRMVASTLTTRTGTPTQTPSEDLRKDLTRRFIGLTLIRDSGRSTPLLGDIQNPPEPTAAEKRHFRAGNTVLSSQYRSDLTSRTFMRRPLDPQQPTRGALLAEINPSYLWGVGDESTLPPMTELCVLDQSNTPLVCSLPGPISFPEPVTLDMTRSSSGQFKWTHAEKEYLASYWSIPLQFRFFVPKWTIVLGESKADVLAPMANFKTIFPLVILMSLWVVLLLSISQIRRSLVPLERLQEGTRRIAARDFESRVAVTSGDEFEELAGSFNAMASRLGRQFNTLATMAEIDRAILSALDTRKIVDVVLTRMRDLLPCDCLSVSLLDPDNTHRAQTYIGGDDAEGAALVEVSELTPEDVQKLRENPESVFITEKEEVPHYLAPLVRRAARSFLVMPIFLKEKLSGAITLGHRDPREYSQDDLIQARQLADQVAVALSNARLIEELDQLNWGTLTALARAIDAKSPWTAGHSERVTELALHIGRALGLSPNELDILHRGGLLHDIGKIGIPASILDKSGKLTEEEFLLMREHPRKGARILEPIPAYTEVIPIVLQHHEWLDGTGYPDGLAGEAISLGGRIFAVADVFDALSSDRPYRAGLDRRRVIELITQGAGRQFDPKVVQAFLEVMAREETASQGDATQSRPLATP
ncbi:MAG: HD domain-containing protein [candidate division NC10 bacterium]|nr:HD domain-containing protein [candidate division NC10 bacterium]